MLLLDFQHFQVGANYEKFCEAAASWKLSLSNLVNFSDTRFANSKNIHHQFAPIILCLKEQIEAGRQNRSGLEAGGCQLSVLTFFALCLGWLTSLISLVSLRAVLEGNYKVKCLWPLNYVDKRRLSEKGKIRDLTVVNKHGIKPVVSRLLQGRR